MTTDDEAQQRRAEMIDFARRVQGAIVDRGGMATKSAVEDILMPVFQIDRSEAHDVLNVIEFCNLKWIGRAHVARQRDAIQRTLEHLDRAIEDLSQTSDHPRADVRGARGWIIGAQAIVKAMQEDKP